MEGLKMILTKEQIESLRDTYECTTNPDFASGMKAVLEEIGVPEEQIHEITG